MSELHQQLLRQARRQSRSRNPNDATIRRAVSTAYYALFHAITFHASAMCEPRYGDARLVLRRAFSHSAMKQCCTGFSKQTVPTAITQKLGRDSYSPPADIRGVASVFVKLQETRHRADYDHASTVAQGDAVAAVRDAADGINKLVAAANAHPNDMGLFLYAMLCQRGSD